MCEVMCVAWVYLQNYRVTMCVWVDLVCKRRLKRMRLGGMEIMVNERECLYERKDSGKEG